MPGVREHVGDGPLDDRAEVHDRDVVGDLPDDGEVVRDEEVGESETLAQVLEQVDDTRLDGHIERRDGLVEDQYGGLVDSARAMPMRWR
jgi:hypothetical protein